MKTTKTTQYHDATNTGFYLHFSRYFTWNSSKRFSTTMLQMTCSISILFHGIFHAIHQNSSVPWCYKQRALSIFLMRFSIDFTKTARYQDAKHNARYLMFFAVFPIKITKAARYHDATYNSFYLYFSCYLPWNSSKRLSTTMLQITSVVSFFCYISHENHQYGSVPWCYKLQMFICILHLIFHQIHQNGSQWQALS